MDPDYKSVFEPALRGSAGIRAFYVAKWIVIELGLGFVYMLNLWVSEEKSIPTLCFKAECFPVQLFCQSKRIPFEVNRTEHNTVDGSSTVLDVIQEVKIRNI